MVSELWNERLRAFLAADGDAGIKAAFAGFWRANFEMLRSGLFGETELKQLTPVLGSLVDRLESSRVDVLDLEGLGSVFGWLTDNASQVERATLLDFILACRKLGILVPFGCDTYLAIEKALGIPITSLPIR